MAVEVEVHWEGGTEKDSKNLVPILTRMGGYGKMITQKGYIFFKFSKEPTEFQFHKINSTVRRRLRYVKNLTIVMTKTLHTRKKD